MKSHRLLLSTLVLSGGTGTALFAQTPAPVPDDQDIPVRYMRPMRHTVSIGMKLTNGGGNVTFGNLGNINRSPFNPNFNINKDGPAPASNVRNYDNGSLSFDTQSDLEKNPWILDASAVRRDPTTNEIIYDANGSVALGTATRVEANGALPIKDGRLQDTILRPKFERDANGKLPTKTVPLLDGNGNQVIDSDDNPVTQTIQIFKPILDANGNVVTELVEGDRWVRYDENATRLWEIAQAEQFLLDSQGNRIGAHFDLFSTRTEGASVNADIGSSKGVEVGFERLFRRESNRFEWGLKGTIGLNTIKGQSNAKVTSTLVRARDTFLISSTSPFATIPVWITDTLPYNFQAGTRAANTPPEIATYPDETRNVEYTVPLSVLPMKGSNGEATQYTYTSGGVEVDGKWQIKGAAVNLRIGPSARFYFSPRFSISGTAGVSVNYYSTRFNIHESMKNPATGENTTFDSANLFAPNGRDRFDNSKTGVVIGPSAEVNLEWWMTPNTGLYVGGSYEKTGSYSQQLGSQFAKVELGNGVAYRLGINTRF